MIRIFDNTIIADHDTVDTFTCHLYFYLYSLVLFASDKVNLLIYAEGADGGLIAMQFLYYRVSQYFFTIVIVVSKSWYCPTLPKSMQPFSYIPSTPHSWQEGQIFSEG